jgi:hypothetical protein
MNKQQSIESEETETVSDDSDKKDTSTISMDSTGIEAGGTVYDIHDELHTSGIFRYPRVDELLQDKDEQPGVLTEVEFATGKFGESVALKIDGRWYRSGSKPILDEAQQLMEGLCCKEKS